MAPVGLVLLFLTGVGPLLAWRKSSLSNLRSQFLWPTLGAVVTGVGVSVLGIQFWASGLCFALCAFVTVTIGQEFWRGARVRQEATGTDVLTALIGLFARSRRRYGGYVVHLGIVLVFLGFAGNGFKREQQVTLLPGQQMELAPYIVRYQKLSVTDDGQKQMITAHVDTLKSGSPAGAMYPAKWFFRNHETEPTTEVALRRSVADDLYVVLNSYEVETQRAILSVTINPLVNWIWLGVGIILIGTGIALLPERAFAFATSRVPEGAVTTLLVILLIAGSVSQLRAQHVEQPETVVIPPKSPLEKEMQDAIICMCGTCGRKRIGECTCPDAGAEREELARLTAAGKNREQIIQYFVQKYGSQEVLAQPIDRGFNRLAWLFPYFAGLAGAVTIGGVAWRWSRTNRSQRQAAAPEAVTANAELQAKLDDELRDLD
jgi:cytochrome c-type biogenesis protein CcmF